MYLVYQIPNTYGVLPPNQFWTLAGDPDGDGMRKSERLLTYLNTQFFVLNDPCTAQQVVHAESITGQ